jgi:hypothetical protein
MTTLEKVTHSLQFSKRAKDVANPRSKLVDICVPPLNVRIPTNESYVSVLERK